MLPLDVTTAVPDWPYGYGFCHCGCGQETTPAPKSNHRTGRVKGVPARYRRGHHGRITPDKLAEHLWSRVDRSGGPDACWPWLGATDSDGYGTVHISGRTVTVTRLIWELLHGPIPHELHVLHRCDNPPCCNPADWFLGTHTENMADRKRKGRSADFRGARNPNARLSPDDVRAVRAAFDARIPRGLISTEHNISVSLVEKIGRRIAWKDLE